GGGSVITQACTQGCYVPVELEVNRAVGSNLVGDPAQLSFQILPVEGHSLVRRGGKDRGDVRVISREQASAQVGVSEGETQEHVPVGTADAKGDGGVVLGEPVNQHFHTVSRNDHASTGVNIGSEVAGGVSGGEVDFPSGDPVVVSSCEQRGVLLENQVQAAEDRFHVVGAQGILDLVPGAAHRLGGEGAENA